MKYYLIFIAFFMINCSSSESKNQARKSTQSQATYESIDQSTQDSNVQQPSNTKLKGDKITKDGSMKLEVKELTIAKAKVEKLVNSFDGYFEKETYKTFHNRKSYNLNIRVPNQSFDTIVSELETNYGTFIAKNIRAKDITEEYVDLEIRLDNKLSYLAQYKDILKKAKTIQDILDVKASIGAIELEIERVSGRLKFLDDQVRFSSLDLELSQTENVFYAKNKLSNRIAKGFKNGINIFISFLVMLVNIWPFILLFTLLIFFRKNISNLFSRKQKP